MNLALLRMYQAIKSVKYFFKYALLVFFLKSSIMQCFIIMLYGATLAEIAAGSSSTYQFTVALKKM